LGASLQFRGGCLYAVEFQLRSGRLSLPHNWSRSPEPHDGFESVRYHGGRSPAERMEPPVTNDPLDELGPVDFVVVEFPVGTRNFTGEAADELLALVEAGSIRLIDMLVLEKNEDGTVEAMELSDLGDLGPFQTLEAELADFLAADDVAHLAVAMDPGSIAGVLVYENLWAAPFASAVRRAGGQLIANGRIPAQAILAAIEADEALESEGA
jgi:hypothetical protein